MKKRWKGIRTLCLVVCGLMMAGVSAKADNGLGVTKHTKKEIAEYIKETQADIKSDKIGYKENKDPDPGKMTMAGASSLSDSVINSALLKLNQYRYIAGLDAVTANKTYSDYAQALAFVKAYGSGLSSDKLEPTLYQNYLEGEKYSNYATGCNGVVPAIEAWMKNSDTRQQMMKSSMSETGFGFIYDATVSSGNSYYATMYTGQGDTTVKNVAWPAQITPTAFFDSGDKWTFATGREESLGNITVTVTRLRDNKKWTFDKSGGLTVSNNTSGLKGYLVFQPKLDSLPSGDQFQVQITGLVQGSVSYSVEFFNADKYAESTGDAQYDDNGICKYTTLVDGVLTHDDDNCPKKNSCNGYMPAVCISEGNYEIGNAGQLYWFADQVNEGNPTYNAVLTKDITVNQNVLNADNTLNSGSYMEWTPIGNSVAGVKYAGTFKGQNHTIYGLYATKIEGTKAGLFVETTADAHILNLGLEDYYFDVSSGIVQYFGAICGFNLGEIDACYSKGCMNATSQTCGGISGFNKGTISNSYSVSVINGGKTRGGICGNNKNVSNCYFDSDVCSGSVVDSSYGKTTAAFKSGEVAYLLGKEQSVWGQTIGVDDTPVLNGSKVYENGDTYSNGQATTKHHYNASGQCTGCGENIGTIKNNSYKTNYTYGDTIPAPKESNFTIPEGAATPTFTWYDGDQTAISDLNSVASQKRNTMPVDPGAYTLVVETPMHYTETATYDASSIQIKVVIAKATPTDYIKPTGLTAKCGDKLSAVSLKVNNTNEKGSFVWTDSDVELKAGSNEEGQTIQKTAKYIPADTNNYNEVEGIVLSIQVTHQAVTDSAVAATCETEGKTAGKHCSACSTIFVRQETIQPLKHHYNADGRCTKCDKNIGTITNNNYKTVYEYCGYAISKPVPANFTFPSGAASPVFTWYNGDQTGVADLNTVSAQKIEGEPVNAGTYTLVVETPAHDTTEAKYDASNLRVKVEIKKVNPTGYIKPAELTAKCGDLLSTVSLKVNDKNEKGSFVWTDSDVKLEAGSDVNGQTITKSAKYIPEHTENYNEVDGIELSIKIEHELKGTDTTSHNATCTSCGKAFSLSTCVGGKATCTSSAICSICGQPYGDVDTENGHEYEPAYNWSDNGESCTIALVCKRKECSESVPNHKLTRMCMVTSKVTQEATCTEVEKTMRTATYSFYDKEYKVSKAFDTRSALGHQEVEDPAVEATCVKEGKTAGKHCSVCKTVTLEQKVVPATGQHSWDEGKITKKPTKTEEGIKTYTCTSCQQTKWETIQKLNGDTDNPGGNTGDSGNTDNPGGNTGDSGNTDNPGGNTGDSGNTDNPGGNTGDNGNPNKPGGDTDNGQQPPAPSDTAGGGQQPSTPTDNTETVKVGMVISDDKAAAKYQITNVDKKEVSFVKLVNKKAKKITVPDTVKIDGKTYKVTCVSSKTFSGTNKCKTIIIGKNVTSIKANAFSGCKNVKTIIFKTTKLTKKTVAKNAFKGITKKTTIKVPKKKVSSYKKIFKSKGLSSKVKVKA